MKKVYKTLNILTICTTICAGAGIITLAIIERIRNTELFDFPLKIVIGICFILFAGVVKIFDKCETERNILLEMFKELSEKKEYKKHSPITENEYGIIECDERECLNNQSGYCSLLHPEFDSENNCVSAKVGDR